MALAALAILFLLSPFAGLIAVKDKETSSVETQYGTFIGYIRNFRAFEQDFQVRRFLGIPYAEAPVGNLRFEKPERKAKLKQPYDATFYRPSCIQQMANLGGPRKHGRFESMQFSEDCLFLNIYTPAESSPKLQERLPVMIYIHGGAFVSGSPEIYASDILSAYGNVVVVTIAYRLSIWGFLSTGDENLPGNYGLWDQQMAIQWVHDNVINFRGDPEHVTLIGSSAGGTSVVFQGLYPGNKGLFKKIIAQSGSITCPWAISSDPLVVAKRLGELVSCQNHITTKELAECLSSKSTKELENVLNAKENNFNRFPMEILPVVDGAFIQLSPKELFYGSSKTARLYRNALRDLDLMAGVTSNEGLLIITPYGLYTNTDTFETDRAIFETELVPQAASIAFGKSVPSLVNTLIVNEYTHWEDAENSFNARDSFIKMSGDYAFNVQTIELALLHSGNSDTNTYVYLYDAFPSRHLFPVTSWTDKPQHLDDLTTLFGYDNEGGFVTWTTPYTEDQPDEWELELSKAHITMWTNFARSGDPNGPVDVKPYIKTTWPKYDKQSQRYLNISRHMTENSAGKGLFARSTNFWVNVLPEVIQTIQHSTTGLAGNSFCERDGECRP